VPSRARPNRRTPTCDDDTLQVKDGAEVRRLRLDSPDWRAWLNDPSHTTFAYAGRHGSFTARREQRGSRAYWYAYRQRDGTLHKVYLGSADAVTRARVAYAASALQRPPPGDSAPIIDRAVALQPSETLRIAAPSLVGRDGEVDVLMATLSDAIAGHGSLVLISGEAGIGKTTLAEVLCREATAGGAAVLTGRCYDLSETPPYGPWREIFARSPRNALPSLPEAVLPLVGTADAPVSQAFIVARVRDYLAALATQQPVVILLDDLHWSDPASLDLLRLLGRELASMPVLIIVAYRDDQVTHSHPLSTIVPLLIHESRTRRIELRRLDAANIGALVTAQYALDETDHGRLVRYLVGRAEGNPFFLTEVLRTLEAEGTLRRAGEGWALGDLAGTPVPPLLRQVITGRVARLAPEMGRLLSVAAVIGPETPLATWAAVSGVAEDELLAHAERAIEARLLVEQADGTGVHFAHALIREALYDATSAVRRRALHRQAGEELAVAGNPDPDAVAYHFQRAGDPRAFVWLVRAGLRAYQSAAWLTAVERFTAATALPDEAGAHVRIRGWLLFGSARLLMFSDNARALGMVSEAEPLALTADDRLLATHIRFTRGNLLALRGEIRQGLAAMERESLALDMLPTGRLLPPGRNAALAMISALVSDGDAAVSISTRASTVPPTSPYRDNLVTWFAHTGRYCEAIAKGEGHMAAVGATLDSDRPATFAAVQLGLGQAYAALGHPVAARTAYAHSRAHYYAEVNAHMVGFTIWSELLLAVLPYQADDVTERSRLVAEAAQAWERARGTITDTPHRDPTDLPLALLEGRWAAASELARATLTAATAGHAHGAIAALGVLARQQGATDAAWARVRELHPAGPATLPGDSYFHHAVVLQALAADMALDAGDLAAAREWVVAHGRWLAWSGAVLWQSDHHRLQARLAATSGDSAAAYAYARAALARATPVTVA
jgi:hypothetical protein